MAAPALLPPAPTSSTRVHRHVHASVLTGARARARVWSVPREAASTIGSPIRRVESAWWYQEPQSCPCGCGHRAPLGADSVQRRVSWGRAWAWPHELETDPAPPLAESVRDLGRGMACGPGQPSPLGLVLHLLMGRVPSPVWARETFVWGGRALWTPGDGNCTPLSRHTDYADTWGVPHFCAPI